MRPSCTVDVLENSMMQTVTVKIRGIAEEAA